MEGENSVGVEFPIGKVTGETKNIGGVESQKYDSSYPRASNNLKVEATKKADDRGTELNINLGNVYDQGGGVLSWHDLVDGERKQVLNLPWQPIVEHLVEPYPDNFREDFPVPPAGTQDGEPPWNITIPDNPGGKKLVYRDTGR